jgi:hypothetical protein
LSGSLGFKAPALPEVMTPTSSAPEYKQFSFDRPDKFSREMGQGKNINRRERRERRANKLECWNNGTMGLGIFIFCPSFQYSIIPFFRFSASSRFSAAFGPFLFLRNQIVCFSGSSAVEDKRMTEEEAESAEVLF